MKVAKVVAPYEIIIEECPIPEINDDEVLLKNKYFGVCGSDLQIYHGKHKSAPMPIIMGHELDAVVSLVGKNVNDFMVGDRVSLQPQITCGKCHPCLQGRSNVCEDLKVIGVHVDGCNCEYYATEPKYLHHIPKEINDNQVVLVEPLAVGVGSIKRSRTFKGGNVVVIGAGTIGNFVAQAAKSLGAENVMITDIVQEKLDYALECGVDYAINTSVISLKDAIEQTYGIRKADVIVDCVAHPAVFKSIIAAARANSEIIITGNYKEPVELEVPLFQRREISIIGHMMYTRSDYEDAIRILYEGKITTSKTISQVLPFDEYAEALKFVDEHPEAVMKMVIEL